MMGRRITRAALAAVLAGSALLAPATPGSPSPTHRGGGTGPAGVGFSLTEAKVRPRTAYFDGQRPVRARFGFVSPAKRIRFGITAEDLDFYN